MEKNNHHDIEMMINKHKFIHSFRYDATWENWKRNNNNNNTFSLKAQTGQTKIKWGPCFGIVVLCYFLQFKLLNSRLANKVSWLPRLRHVLEPTRLFFLSSTVSFLHRSRLTARKESDMPCEFTTASWVEQLSGRTAHSHGDITHGLTFSLHIKRREGGNNLSHNRARC